MAHQIKYLDAEEADYVFCSTSKIIGQKNVLESKLSKWLRPGYLIFRKSLSICLTLSIALTTNAQDFTWWNDTHNWDGHTSWQKYMTMSPAFLGPNALPVPKSSKGIIPESYTSIIFNHIYASDDITNVAQLDGAVRLFSDRVAMQASWIPWEHYKHSMEVRDFRASRDFDGKGKSSGDVYIGTLVQLVKEHPHLPDLVLNFTFRTASGTNLQGARFTDTPGYYIDLSGGRNINLGQAGSVLRPFAQVGLYVWQTYTDLHRQNDAILYGFGVELRVDRFVAESSIRGYHGYLDMGDRPQIWHMQMRYRLNEGNIFLQYGKGIHDFPFAKVGVGVLRLW